MAKLAVEIEPFEVPTTVTVNVGATSAEVPLSDLDDETLGELIEEFTTAVLTAAGKS